MSGGKSEENQAFILKKGVELLIGTPGRILEGLKENYLTLD